MFQACRSFPTPCRSLPCQMSRRLVLSSKKALTCTGSPVLTGRGRTQKAWPSTGEASSAHGTPR